MKKDTLYGVLISALIAWIGSAELRFQSFGERLTRLEDKTGVHAQVIKVEKAKLAYPLLLEVPELTPEPKPKDKP